MNVFDLGIDLLLNASALLALSAAHWVLARHLQPDRPAIRIVSGLLVGASSVAVMMAPMSLQPGLIFDTRTVVLSVGSLFGGLQVGLIAGAMATAYRLWLGGAGDAIGIATILIAVMAGLAWRHWRPGRDLEALCPWELVALGGVLGSICLGLFTLLPLDLQNTNLHGLAMVYLGLLTLTTLVFGLVRREIERSSRFARTIAASARRFERLFQHAAVSIWEEDVSQVWRHLDALRAQGVTDLRAHFAANREIARELAAKVRIVKLNRASLALFEAGSEHNLTGRIDRFWVPGTDLVFVDGLCAIWDRPASFSAETEMRTMTGAAVTVVLSFPVPQSKAEARQVPVCIADITRRRRAERIAELERQHLQEIIRGTNIGTWEWNVHTGETRFNERWAEIAGYSLAELMPVSIQTWQGLCHPDDLARSEAQLRLVFAGELENYDLELRMKHKSGRWVWVQDRGKVMQWDSQHRPLRMSGTHADITERKQSEERLVRIAAMRRAVLNCQRALLQTDDDQAMLQETCEILVEARDYTLAWIGLAGQDQTTAFRPVVRAGGNADSTNRLAAHWTGGLHNGGPIDRAVSTGHSQVVNDLHLVEALAPWAELTGVDGLQAAAVIPVTGPNGVQAVLCVFSGADEGFDEEEVALLTDFAGTLSLVLDNRRSARENGRIGAALARSAMLAVNAIAKTIEKRDPYTSGHQERVAALAVAIAGRLGWDDSRIEGLRLGATIHDIGKIYVPAEILNRPGRLTASEMELIRSHAAIGGEILDGTEFPWPIREMVDQHHERLDGSGYPHGLTAEAILLEAKVLAVADVVEAMSSHRPYRPAKSVEEGLAEIQRGRGTHYDPAAVDACVAVIRESGFPEMPAAQ